MLTLGGAGGCCGAFMNLLIDTDYAPWLVGFALNIGMGLILVIAYNAVRSALPPNSHWLTAAVIGVLFGGSALISMNFPVRTAGGLSIDARNVFILTGSLFGGPVAAIVGGAIAIAYRLWLGGPGAVGGAVSIVVTAAMGVADRPPLRQTGRRSTRPRTLPDRPYQFGGDHGRGRGHPRLAGLRPHADRRVGRSIHHLPARRRPARQRHGHDPSSHLVATQRRLNDIVETVSDLVWETDAMAT